MLLEEEKKRYCRQFITGTFGLDGQLKLKQAKILVIGAGGLGCPALTYLTSTGIGTIGIIDDDRIALSNLPRQILYTGEDVGKHKASVAKERLQHINPHCTIKSYIEKLTKNNALEIVSGYDVVIDGTDNSETRYLIDDTCYLLKRPFVYGAIFKFEGQVSVFNYKDGPTYKSLFPESKLVGGIPSCNETGVLGVLPGILGIYQATEAIKIITGIGQVLSGRLLTFNLLDNSTKYFDIMSDRYSSS